MSTENVIRTPLVVAIPQHVPYTVKVDVDAGASGLAVPEPADTHVYIGEHSVPAGSLGVTGKLLFLLSLAAQPTADADYEITLRLHRSTDGGTTWVAGSSGFSKFASTIGEAVDTQLLVGVDAPGVDANTEVRYRIRVLRSRGAQASKIIRGRLDLVEF